MSCNHYMIALMATPDGEKYYRCVSSGCDANFHLPKEWLPVTAVAEEKYEINCLNCLRNFTSLADYDDHVDKSYKCKPPKEEQKGCIAGLENVIDKFHLKDCIATGCLGSLCGGDCPCSCHKEKWKPITMFRAKKYEPESPQEKCTCEGSFVHPCHYCKTGEPCVTDAKDPCLCPCHQKQCDACDFGSCLVHNTERKEKHCFCGNLSDPNYAHHPKECVFIGSYTEDRPLVKTQIADSLQEKCCCGHPENKNYSYHGKDYCQPFNMFPKEEKDYYTRAEIDAMFQKEEITCDSRFERSKMPSEEEREFRKALLEFLTIPNIGFTKGELISKLELEKKFADLKSRFL